MISSVLYIQTVDWGTGHPMVTPKTIYEQLFTIHWNFDRILRRDNRKMDENEREVIVAHS